MTSSFPNVEVQLPSFVSLAVALASDYRFQDPINQQEMIVLVSTTYRRAPLLPEHPHLLPLPLRRQVAVACACVASSPWLLAWPFAQGHRNSHALDPKYCRRST